MIQLTNAFKKKFGTTTRCLRLERAILSNQLSLSLHGTSLLGKRDIHTYISYFEPFTPNSVRLLEGNIAIGERERCLCPVASGIAALVQCFSYLALWAEEKGIFVGVELRATRSTVTLSVRWSSTTETSIQ